MTAMIASTVLSNGNEAEAKIAKPNASNHITINQYAMTTENTLTSQIPLDKIKDDFKHKVNTAKPDITFEMLSESEMKQAYANLLGVTDPNIVNNTMNYFYNKLQTETRTINNEAELKEMSFNKHFNNETLYEYQNITGNIKYPATFYNLTDSRFGAKKLIYSYSPNAVANNETTIEVKNINKEQNIGGEVPDYIIKIKVNNNQLRTIVDDINNAGNKEHIDASNIDKEYLYTKGSLYDMSSGTPVKLPSANSQSKQSVAFGANSATPCDEDVIADNQADIIKYLTKVNSGTLNYVCESNIDAECPTKKPTPQPPSNPPSGGGDSGGDGGDSGGGGDDESNPPNNNDKTDWTSTYLEIPMHFILKDENNKKIANIVNKDNHYSKLIPNGLQLKTKKNNRDDDHKDSSSSQWTDEGYLLGFTQGITGEQYANNWGRWKKVYRNKFNITESPDFESLVGKKIEPDGCFDGYEIIDIDYGKNKRDIEKWYDREIDEHDINFGRGILGDTRVYTELTVRKIPATPNQEKTRVKSITFRINKHDTKNKYTPLYINLLDNENQIINSISENYWGSTFENIDIAKNDIQFEFTEKEHQHPRENDTWSKYDIDIIKKTVQEYDVGEPEQCSPYSKNIKYEIKLTLKPEFETIDVEHNKTWSIKRYKEEETKLVRNALQKRLPWDLPLRKVKFNLYKDGTFFKSQEFSTDFDGNNKIVFKDVPKYSDPVNKILANYRIQEDEEQLTNSFPNNPTLETTTDKRYIFKVTKDVNNNITNNMMIEECMPKKANKTKIIISKKFVTDINQISNPKKPNTSTSAINGEFDLVNPDYNSETTERLSNNWILMPDEDIQDTDFIVYKSANGVTEKIGEISVNKANNYIGVLDDLPFEDNTGTKIEYLIREKELDTYVPYLLSKEVTHDYNNTTEFVTFKIINNKENDPKKPPTPPQTPNQPSTPPVPPTPLTPPVSPFIPSVPVTPPPSTPEKPVTPPAINTPPAITTTPAIVPPVPPTIEKPEKPINNTPNEPKIKKRVKADNNIDIDNDGNPLHGSKVLEKHKKISEKPIREVKKIIKKVLPTTGGTNNIWLLIFGLILIISGLTGLKPKKRKE